MDEKKVREAIEYLSKYISAHDSLPKPFMWKGKEEYETAIEALEKQLSKKVEVQTEFNDLQGRFICYKGFCPSCGRGVESYRNRSCHICGQMLDWSE